MEQSTPPAMPVMNSGKQSNEKGLKITVILTSLAAVWGVLDLAFMAWFKVRKKIARFPI